MTSDQEPTPTERAAKVSRAVSLRDLRLVELHSELLDGRSHDNYLVDLQVDISPEPQEDMLTYGVRFTLALRPTTTEAPGSGDDTQDATRMTLLLRTRQPGPSSCSTS